MRFAVVGLGGAALRGHLRAIRQLAPRAALVAAAETHPARRAAFASAFPTVPAFSSTADMLGSVSCDVLVVATDPQAHTELVVLGIKHGRHVVCEKPLAVVRADYAQIELTCKQRPDLALIAVHQYRYSPCWASLSRCIRLSRLARLPYRLTATIERPGTDRHAASAWRSDPAASGGVLADLGIHFLALAWCAAPRLELLAARRRVDRAGHERSRAVFSSGSGVLEVNAWNGAAGRGTRLYLQRGILSIDWEDEIARLEIGRRLVREHHVRALSDREHVDRLYEPFYRELLCRLNVTRWRSNRTQEALAVCNALLAALEHAPINGADG